MSTVVDFKPAAGRKFVTDSALLVEASGMGDPADDDAAEPAEAMTPKIVHEFGGYRKPGPDEG